MVHIVIQDIIICIPHKYILFENRIVDSILCEYVFRETCEDDIFRFQFSSNTGELTQLLRAEIGLYGALKGFDEVRDTCDDFGACQFFAKRAQHEVLMIGALEDAIDARARKCEARVPLR